MATLSAAPDFRPWRVFLPLKSCRCAAGFAFFVFWLLSFPMEGPLLRHSPGDLHLFLFLGPHILALFLLARFSPLPFFPRLSQLAVIATALLTLLVPLEIIEPAFLLPAAGLLAAPVCIRSGAALKQADNPVFAGALGLVAGNLLFLLLLRLPLATWIWFCIVAGGLLIILLSSLPTLVGEVEAENRPFLPFLLAFNLVSGIMYRDIAPAYETAAFLPGAEILFYIAAIAASIFLLRRSREVVLICGIVSGMAAILFLRPSSASALNLSMFAMQGAAGCVDLFVMAFFLSFCNPAKAFGYGSAMICSGIFLGGALSLWFLDIPDLLVFAGQVFLNAAAIILLMRRSRTATETAASAGAETRSGNDDGRKSIAGIPAEVRAVLSSKESSVLELVLTGKVYRDIALELAISESTVKTYMSRIYQKLGIYGQRDLKKLLSCRPFPE